MASKRTTTLKDYLSLVKFSHTFFALPFALIGFFIALPVIEGPFRWRVFILILLCMVFARNAAMSFNRVTDRFIDKRNPRTACREIPAGKIHPRNAFIFSTINAILFIITSFFINKLVFYLSPIALMVILGYSYSKRYTYLCHFILGLGLALAPLGAYLSVVGQWHTLPLLYSLIVFLWVAGFDMLYSIQDENFDKEENLKSIPATFGVRATRIISIILHALTILLVIKTGIIQNSGYLFWVGAFIFVLLLVTQHIIIKGDDEKRINFAFATLNGIASTLFALFNILSFYF